MKEYRTDILNMYISIFIYVLFKKFSKLEGTHKFFSLIPRRLVKNANKTVVSI